MCSIDDFVVCVKISFCYRQTKCIDDQNIFQSVKNTGNEFTECQTLRKKLQSIGISPVSLHSFMKTLKSDISVAHKTQVDCLKDADVWFSWYKMIRKRKWMTWLGFKSYCKKNWKQHHIQNKFLPWYLINGLECTVQNILISLNTLFELHMKSKK